MKRGQSVILWIIATLLVYNIFINNKIKTDFEKYENAIENVQDKIDSIAVLNKTLDDRISSLHTELVTIEKDILKVQSNIDILKRKTDEKTNAVDSFTILERKNFFTERYKKRLDSASQSTNR